MKELSLISRKETKWVTMDLNPLETIEGMAAPPCDFNFVYKIVYGSLSPDTVALPFRDPNSNWTLCTIYPPPSLLKDNQRILSSYVTVKFSKNKQPASFLVVVLSFVEWEVSSLLGDQDKAGWTKSDIAILTG